MKVDITSIPAIISRYGSLVATIRQTGFSEATIRRYQFDYNMEKHVILNGVLMTSRNVTPKLVTDNKPSSYQFVNNQLVRVE